MINRTRRRFSSNERGNVSTIFSLTLIPVVGLVGMGVDYSTGSGVKARLDSIADSASLAAVTPALLSQSDQASINVATTLFNSQAASIQGIGTISLTVAPQDSGLTRTVTVTYSTTRKTLFGSLAGASTMVISGTSQSSATVPPNIDFYLLLDNSPSMAIAATTAGISTMVSHTPDQCAFACHESDTSPNDYYGLARGLGVTLRMDLLDRRRRTSWRRRSSNHQQRHLSRGHLHF